MLSSLFFKPLKSLPIEVEQSFTEEIVNSRKSIWLSARQHDGGSIDFVKENTESGFYTARLKRFPNIVQYLRLHYPDVVIEHSYVTKLLPGYHMKPHIDKNRDTAILMPLGTNKGEIEFYQFGIKIHTHEYNSPIIARVDKVHGANNTSDDIRYALTLEVSGLFKENKDKYI